MTQKHVEIKTTGRYSCPDSYVEFDTPITVRLGICKYYKTKRSRIHFNEHRPCPKNKKAYIGWYIKEITYPNVLNSGEVVDWIDRDGNIVDIYDAKIKELVSQ